MLIIAHGDNNECLLSEHKNGKQTELCRLEDFRKDLDGIESLAGKPKLVVLHACRGEGGEYSFNQDDSELSEMLFF